MDKEIKLIGINADNKVFTDNIYFCEVTYLNGDKQKIYISEAEYKKRLKLVELSKILSQEIIEDLEETFELVRQQAYANGTRDAEEAGRWGEE